MSFVTMASKEEQTISYMDGHIGSEFIAMSRNANGMTQNEMASSVGVDGDCNSLQPQESKQVERNPKGASGLGKKFAAGIAFVLFFLLAVRAFMQRKPSPNLIPRVGSPLPSKDIPIEPVEPEREDKGETKESGRGDGEEEAAQVISTPEGTSVSGEGEGEEEAAQVVSTPEGTKDAVEKGEEETAEKVPTPEGTGEDLEKGLPSKEVPPQEPVPSEEPSPEKSEEPFFDPSEDKENIPTMPIDEGYKPATCLLEKMAIFMFKRIVVFEGTMQILKPIPKGESQQTTEYATFLITAEPAVHMTEMEVVESDERELREELSESLVVPVGNAMQKLLREEGPDESANPVRQLTSPGYGTIYVQRVREQQFSRIHGVRESDKERPARPLHTEMTIDNTERAAEEIEAVIKTGRGVVVVHYPKVDIVACISQPKESGDARPVLEEDFPTKDELRMEIIELLNAGVNEMRGHYPIMATLRLVPGPGVPTTTFVSMYFFLNDPKPRKVNKRS